MLSKESATMNELSDEFPVGYPKYEDEGDYRELMRIFQCMPVLSPDGSALETVRGYVKVQLWHTHSELDKTYVWVREEIIEKLTRI